MSELYKVIEIPGKGKGCLALKKIKAGTLILSEKTHVTAPNNTAAPSFFRRLMSSFDNLSEDDKEKYMNLYNRFEEKPSNQELPKSLFNGMTPKEIETYSAQVLKVFDIYNTNNFDDGVAIKISR